MNRTLMLCFILTTLIKMGGAQNTERPSPVSLTFKLNNLRVNTLKAKSEKETIKLNNVFKEELKLAIQQNLAFDADSIQHFGIVSSPDNYFKIYTWNILKEFNAFEYFAFVKTKKGELIELTDQSAQLVTPELKTCNTKNWYGALYYEIIPVKNSSKEKYYVLLGWDGNSDNSTKKIIDILYYDKTLEAWQLGKKIFGPPFKSNTRFIIEYSKDVTASLKYHKNDNRIIFDHLVPLHSGLKGVYDFYVPDLSFDGFKFRKDYWYFIQNVDVRGEQKMDNYTTPKTNIKLN